LFQLINLLQACRIYPSFLTCSPDKDSQPQHNFINSTACMDQKQSKFKNVREYFSTLTPEKKKALQELRNTIKDAAPHASELISYNLPAFKLHTALVYYAAWKEHIGFYPASPTVTKVFKKELEPYRQSKGTIQFPYHDPLPLSLITRIIKHRVKENIEKEAAKQKTR